MSITPESADAWVKEVRTKVEEAIEASKHTPPIDGETFINQILERFQMSDRCFPDNPESCLVQH